jgi:predicted nucleic acid-binding protein
VLVVVADASPLHYLVLTDTVDLIPRLFKRVIVPEIVRAELLHPEAPMPVRGWATEPPAWLVVSPAPVDAGDDLTSLDDGERAAIALSSNLKADLILMDDRDGVAVARGRGARGLCDP